MDQDNTPQGNRCSRRQLPPIKVWVNAKERNELESRAAQTGLSLSTYMKVAGLNQPVRVRADLLAVTDLVKVNTELGRLAEALKGWLDKKPMQGAWPREAEALIKETRQLQQALRSIMAQLVK